MEAETLPGLFRGSHSFSGMLDNGGAVAHNQLLVCHYYAAYSLTLYLVNDMKGKGGSCRGLVWTNAQMDTDAGHVKS